MNRLILLKVKKRFSLCILAVSAIVSLAFAASAGQDSLTVKEAVDKIVQNNHTLHSLAAQLDAAQAKTQNTKTAYYPTVSADASYANIGPGDNLKIKFGGSSLPMAPMNNYDAHVGANILIYDFGKRKLNTKAAELSEEIIKTHTTGATSAIVFQALNIVTNIVMMQQSVAIQNENIESLERLLNTVKKRLETGAGTSYDVLKTETQLASSQAGLLDIKNNLEKLRIDLSKLIRMSADSLPSIKSNLDTAKFSGKTDSLMSITLEQRTEITSEKNTIAELKIQKELIEKEMKPVLMASVSTGIKDGYTIDVSAPQINDPKFNWVAGVQLHVPLYDGSQQKYHLKEIDANLRAAEESLDEVVDGIRADVLKAIADVNTYYAKLASSALQIKLSEEALKLAQKSLDAGTITNDDVLNTQKDYSQAKLSNLQDKIRYTLSLFILNWTTGNSTVK